MLIFLFGKAGAGKSYVAQILEQEFNMPHIEGDDFLTEKMLQSINSEKLFTEDMISNYIHNIVAHIHTLPNTNKHNYVITQALYRKKHRQKLQSLFPTAKFILIDADDETCYQRIRSRNNKITLAYAKKIRHFYEEPDMNEENIIVINNDHQSTPTAT